MRSLHSDPSIDILIDESARILHVNWKGYHSLHSATRGCQHILELTSRHGTRRILNDNSEVRGLWMEAAEWAAKDWFPQLREAGMERFAWVYSPAKFSQISADTALALIDTEALGIKVFHDRASAIDWLQQAG